MRVLHIGSGFRPWRWGGLVAYVEDLIAEQTRRGHEVTYLFSGRQYPWRRTPRVRRWERDGVPMLEIVNSPLYDHGRQPELEISEPLVERIVERTVANVAPDVVHVQELAGLPFSVIDAVRRAGLPVVATLQDYFPLCATFKLLDAEGQVCLRREIGADCATNVAAMSQSPALLLDATIRHDFTHSPLIRVVPRRYRWSTVAKTASRLTRSAAAAEVPPSPPEAFQRRREAGLRSLNSADRVIGMSHRLTDIYEQLGVDSSRLRTVHLTLAHIERLRPRRAGGTAPVTFATLGGGESDAKGSRVLLDAARMLAAEGEQGRFRLLLFGYVRSSTAAEARTLPGVEVRGVYKPRDLDAMLDEVDVGIMPSAWEEAYGYAGIEFLAKGIPVLANAIGGLVDYTREGETGWLNRSCSAEELAEIMRGIIDRPQQVAELNGRIVANRDAIVKPLARHADEMDELYREAIAERR